MQPWQEPFEEVGASTLWPWRFRAACRDADAALFYAPDGELGPKRRAREARAKAICASCPVIHQCAAYAIRYGERYGIWGGMSERERAALALRPNWRLAVLDAADVSRA